MELPRLLEALLFASDKPLPAKQMVAMLRDAAEAEPGDATAVYANIKEDDIHAALDQLSNLYEEQGAGVMLREIAGGFQLRSHPDAASWVRLLFEDAKPARLSQPALETLAIVAYRQPISRAEIESVRGVAVDGVVATLVERNMIKTAGRSEQPGRPLLYATTANFLEEFGLKALDELPNADELRRMHLQKQAEEEEQAKQEELNDQKKEEKEEAKTDDAGEDTTAEAEGEPDTAATEASVEDATPEEPSEPEDSTEVSETKPAG